MEKQKSTIGKLARTPLGRTCLITFVLLVVFAVSSKGCSRNDAVVVEEPAGEISASQAHDLPPSPTGFANSLPVAQQYKALVTRYGSRVSSTEEELVATREALEAMRKEVEASRREALKRQQEDPQKLLEQVRTIMREQGLSQGSPGRPVAGVGQPVPGGEEIAETIVPRADLRVITLSPPLPPKKKARRLVHITAATSGTATVLNGVWAGVSGEPSPVRLRFDAALLGPNRSRVPLRSAYLIGKAQGDANSARVTIQIEKLSYVTRDGRPVESPVHGYVVGDDGLEGVPGKYEWRIADTVPLAAVSKGIAGGTDALAQREATSSVTPFGGSTNVVTGNPLKFAGFRSLSGTSDKMSEIFAERMREVRPAVSIPSNRKVNVVFLEGVTLEDLGIEEIDYENDYHPYRGLDLHR